MACVLPAFLLAGCGATDLPDPAPSASDADFAIISDTAAAPSSPTAARPPLGNPAYISFEPGTVPSATQALIRNERTGELVTANVVDGGLDPISILAAEGDRLDITVVSPAGPVMRLARAVPSRRRPKVVRVNPPRGRGDVAINASVVIVFSEPVDPATVTGSAIRLDDASGTAIGGEILLAADGLSATFIPGRQLEPATDYRLTVTDEVRDLDGSPIEAVEATSFRTRGIPEAPTPIPGALQSNVIAFGNFLGGIMLIAPDGAATASLFGTTERDRDPAWSPDGTRIVLTRQAKSGEPELVILSADGTGTSSLVGRGADGAWSPDGTQIAFTSRRGGNRDIFVMRADGTELVQLTETPAHDFAPAWSPDGTRLVFVRAGGDFDVQGKLVVMNADGSDPSVLPQEGSDPAWSPDGSSIAFARLIFEPFHQDIWTMNADGSGARRITSNGFAAMSNGPTWSPDGRRLAFAHTPDGDFVPFQIYVIGTDGTGMMHVGPDLTGQGLVSASFGPAWSPR